MKIFAIDPGTYNSAIVGFDGESVVMMSIMENSELSLYLKASCINRDAVVIEGVKSYMQRIGQETIDTALWSGRFAQAALNGCSVYFVFRKDVRKTLCGNGAARDPDIRDAVIDRYGGSRGVAIGKKAKPGPLYGAKKDIWQALGLGLAFMDGAEHTEIK